MLIARARAAWRRRPLPITRTTAGLCLHGVVGARGMVMISPQLGQRLQIDARRQAKPSRLSQLLVVAKSYKNLESVITIQLHKELRTRIGHQILRLQHLLPPSRGVRQLIALHISIYEKLWELDGMVTDMNSREPKPILMESFANLMSEIEGRMSTVVETLMEGLRESQRAQDEGSLSPDGTVDLPTPMIRGQVDRFLQARIGISTLVRHYLDINKAPGQEPFTPSTNPIFPSDHDSDAAEERHSPFSDDVAPPSTVVRNQAWGSILENASIKELVEDCRAEVDQLSEHYYADRIPGVNIIDEGDGAYATLIPAQFHHSLFEILKNAYKATVESAQRKNLNTIPSIQIRIFPGKDEVCVRVRDYGDGMTLRRMAKATTYLYTSSESYEKLQGGEGGQQRSYQPMTEAMSGMGIGLPISRLYARHWGGDIRVISVQGWGTDVAIYMSKKDLPEAIPTRVFD